MWIGDLGSWMVIMKNKVLILTLIWLLTACAPAVTPEPTQTAKLTPPLTLTLTTMPALMTTPTLTLLSTLTPTPTPLETTTIMTYNIESGAGAGLTDQNGPWCCGPPDKRGCCGASGGWRPPCVGAGGGLAGYGQGVRAVGVVSTASCIYF